MPLSVRGHARTAHGMEQVDAIGSPFVSEGQFCADETGRGQVHSGGGAIEVLSLRLRTGDKAQ